MLTVFFAEVDAPDQFRIRRAQFGNQTAMTGAEPCHLSRRISGPVFRLARHRRGQLVTARAFAEWSFNVERRIA